MIRLGGLLVVLMAAGSVALATPPLGSGSTTIGSGPQSPGAVKAGGTGAGATPATTAAGTAHGSGKKRIKPPR